MFPRRFFPGTFFAARYFPESQGGEAEATGTLPQHLGWGMRFGL